MIVAISFSSSVLGQTKVDKFCILNVLNLKFDKRNVSIRVTFGEQDSLFAFKDTSIIIAVKSVEKQTTLGDALNYLGSIGWTYINELHYANFGEYLFVFKRSFDKSELK